jgi:hypothetical protein
VTTFDWVSSVQLAALSEGANVTTANVCPTPISGMSMAIVTSGGGTASKHSSGKLLLKNNTSGVARIEGTLAAPTALSSILIKATLSTTNPATNSRIIEVMDNQGSPGSKLRVDHLTTGAAQLYNSTNASIFTTSGAGADLANDVFIHVGSQTDTTTTGKYRMNVYDGAYTLIGGTTYSSDAANVGLVANLERVLRVGRINTITDTSDLLIDYIRWSDSQITPLAPLASPPTLVVDTPEGPFYAYKANTSSTPGSGGALTYSASHISGPNNLASSKEPVDGWFFFKQATSASTYRITVSESGNEAFQDVVVPAIETALPSGAIRERYFNGTSWV